MKKILAIILFALCCNVLSAQTTYPIRADSVRLYSGSTSPGAGAELILQNASRSIENGLLTNINNRGNTEFRKLVLTNSGNVTTGSILGITGQSTISLPWLKPYVDTMYLNAGNLLYQKNGNTYTVVLPVGAAYTASNYLTMTANNVTLGGNATGATTLNALAFPLSITANDVSGGTSSLRINSISSTGTEIKAAQGGNTSTITNLAATTDITGSNPTNGTSTLARITPALISLGLTIDPGGPPLSTTLSITEGANLFNDGVNASGISYGNNYAANNSANPRWIPDKGYIDSMVASGGVPDLEAVMLQGSTVNIPGPIISLTSSSGTDGAQFQGFDGSGAAVYLQAVPAGAMGYGQLILSGDSSFLYTRHDLNFRLESLPYNFATLHEDGRFTGANGTGQLDFITLRQSTLEPTRTTAATTTLAIYADRNIFCNNTTDIVVNLPAVTGISGKTYFLKKIGNNSSLITITPSGGALIENAANVVLGAYLDYVVLKCDGVNWYLSSTSL